MATPPPGPGHTQTVPAPPHLGFRLGKRQPRGQLPGHTGLFGAGNEGEAASRPRPRTERRRIRLRTERRGHPYRHHTDPHLPRLHRREGGRMGQERERQQTIRIRLQTERLPAFPGSGCQPGLSGRQGTERRGRGTEGRRDRQGHQHCLLQHPPHHRLPAV